MNSLPRQKLFQIIRQQGWQSARDSRLMEKLLIEQCGKCPEVHALVAALDEGIVESLLTTGNEEITYERFIELVDKLRDNTGILEDMAHWAVESWGIVTGNIPADGMKPEKPAGEAPDSKAGTTGRNPAWRIPAIVGGIVLFVCLVTAVIIGIASLAAGGNADDNPGQPSISPGLSETPSVTPLITEQPTPIPTPTAGPTPGTTVTPTPAQPQGEYGNTLPNLTEGGYTAFRDGYIYFANSTDGWSLYKRPENSFEYKKLANDSVCFINVVGNWIYYVNVTDDNKLYRVKTDGTGREKVFNEQMFQAVVIGNWVYFQGREPGNLKKRKIGGSSSTALTQEEVYRIFPVSNWIYYTNGAQIFRVHYDGRGNERIYGQNPISWFSVYDNSLFFCLEPAGTLFTSRMDGSNATSVCGDPIGSYNFDGDWIYYVNVADGSHLYKIRRNGTGRQKLNDDSSDAITVSGGWIYYINHSDGDRLYRIRPEGTGRDLEGFIRPIIPGPTLIIPNT
jgi:hypothetical protein